LSLPIDYWDYLGWKDTLAKPRHSARQRSYAQVRGDRQVYTPQIVVNGIMQVQGSDKTAIERAVEQTRTKSETVLLPVSLALTADRLLFTLPEHAGANGQSEIWLCALTKRVPVMIGRGENRGRTINYHNVVRRWVKLGDWNGGAQTRSVSAADFKGEGVDAVAIIVQTGAMEKPGKILAAGLASTR
jgi:hypothetical protein